MRALLLREPLKLEVVRRDEPTPVADEALVKVHRVGICGSDLHAYRGHHPYVTYPRILGHELGVEILEVADNPRGLRSGDRACVEPILSCGTCYPCRQGRTNCCTTIRVFGIHVDGGMAERIVVPIDRLHTSTIDLSYEELALCETLSIGVQAVRRAGLEAGETVAVLGAGPIGLGVLVACLAREARVLVSDPSKANRAMALAMGAAVAIDPNGEDLTAAAIRFGEPDGGVRVTFEAVGSPETIARSIDLTAPTGRIVVIGICKAPVPLSISDLMRKEIDLRTTRNSVGAFPAVLDLFREHRGIIGRMITHRFAFDEGPRAIARLHEGRGESGVIKAILEVG